MGENSLGFCFGKSEQEVRFYVLGVLDLEAIEGAGLWNFKFYSQIFSFNHISIATLKPVQALNLFKKPEEIKYGAFSGALLGLVPWSVTNRLAMYDLLVLVGPSSVMAVGHSYKRL